MAKSKRRIAAAARKRTRKAAWKLMSTEAREKRVAALVAEQAESKETLSRVRAWHTRIQECMPDDLWARVAKGSR